VLSDSARIVELIVQGEALSKGWSNDYFGAPITARRARSEKQSELVKEI
jgi:hypothetical protein